MVRGAGAPSCLPNCSQRDRAWAAPRARHFLMQSRMSTYRAPADVGTDRHPFRCCATRTFTSCIYFDKALSVWNPAHFNPKEDRHASASNFPEFCSDGLRHHPSKYRVFARVSGNVGTTKGLHARRLAAMRCANPRCGQDRGLLTAKYSATQRSVPRSFRTKRQCAHTWRGSRLRAETLRSRLWAEALRLGIRAKALRL
jgi:hypothetical protein